MASVTECPSCGNTYSRIGQHWSISECSAPPIPDDLMDIATGVVMGDGTVSNRDKTPYLEVRSVSRDYMIYLDEIFDLFSSGMKNTGAQETSYTDSDIYRWSTRTHGDLSVFDSWYDGGDKHIPTTIDVNDTVLSHWYVCDGSLDRGRMVITCHTDQHRIEELASTIEYRTYTSGDKIIVPRREAKQFFSSTVPIDGYRNKWP